MTRYINETEFTAQELQNAMAEVLPTDPQATDEGLCFNIIYQPNTDGVVAYNKREHIRWDPEPVDDYYRIKISFQSPGEYSPTTAGGRTKQEALEDAKALMLEKSSSSHGEPRTLEDSAGDEHV